MNDESNWPQRQLRAIGDVVPFAGRDASAVDKSTVAAVEVSDRDGVATDAEKTVTAADLRRRKSQIAVRTSTYHDVMSNGNSTNI